jgi:hypothetical protein
MNEELVEIRQSTHPADAEEPDGRAGADARDESRKVLAMGKSGPTPLREPLEGPRQNEARASDEIVLAQHEMGGEVVRSPPAEQGRNRRAELVEKIAQLKALLRIERDVTHEAGVYERSTELTS